MHASLSRQDTGSKYRLNSSLKTQYLAMGLEKHLTGSTCPVGEQSSPSFNKWVRGVQAELQKVNSLLATLYQ